LDALCVDGTTIQARVRRAKLAKAAAIISVAPWAEPTELRGLMD
jgi:hypothetical protein